jgi:uncharacterized protein YutE (UPF0331/DUF86 family)
VVQADKAQRLLSVLLDSIADLKRYRATITREHMKNDRDTQHMVLHAMYVCVQAALDLALHASADAGLPQASTYQDAFRRIAELGWIDENAAGKLAAWAGFRNVLAHFYPVLDYDRAFDALAELEDLEAFAVVIAARVQGG